MLILREPDVYEKFQVLGEMTSDDLTDAQALSGYTPTPRPMNKRMDPRTTAGVYPAQLPNGKRMQQLRVMFTDHCIMDCQYCPNSIYVPRKRFAFKVEELARLFMELYERHTVEGLFVSSGISGSPDGIMERVVQVVEMLRTVYRFRGYIHLKVMPGASYQYVEAAHRLGSRVSINIETPTAEMMRRISPHKDLEHGILEPMRWIHNLISREAPGAGAIGQATQFVVGAADETDRDIFDRATDLYDRLGLKRAYYMPFFQARYTPLEEHPPTPILRAGRLYQLDWLKRFYHFIPAELSLAFGRDSNLPLDISPKMAIALEHVESFPVDVNRADPHQLLRVPGIGPISARRIVENRERHAINAWRDLRVLGVVEKQARPFVVFPGHRPEPVRQGKLDLWGLTARDQRQATRGTGYGMATGCAACQGQRGCEGCALAKTMAQTPPLAPEMCSA